MFNPTLKTTLNIDGQTLRFAPHPVVPTLVWGQEGRHAVVYRMVEVESATQSGASGGSTAWRSPGVRGYALKVFRPVFRHHGLLESAEALSWAHELPGMRVCDQKVITEQTHPALVAQYEDLDYAMLMPWITGQTWFDFLQKRERTTLDQSRALAESMAWVLYALELNQLAHCDLSSGNVIIDPTVRDISLVDVEDLYSPWLTPPPLVPAGTPGYQHREVREGGQWRPEGDRFAGAVLMAEMLGWAHPDVRRNAWGESYFDPDELQQDNDRYRTLRDVLRHYDPGFAEVFEAAWHADDLDDCPPLKAWYDLHDTLPREPVAKWAQLDPGEFEGEVDRPADIAVPVEVTPPAAAASPADAPPKRGFLRLRGCRLNFAVVAVILTLLLCYAGFVGLQVLLARNVFGG